MTQTLRDKVRTALDDADAGGYYGEDDDIERIADLVMQTIANHIGVSVEGLEHLREAVAYIECDAAALGIHSSAHKLRAKLKGQNND